MKSDTCSETCSRLEPNDAGRAKEVAEGVEGWLDKMLSNAAINSNSPRYVLDAPLLTSCDFEPWTAQELDEPGQRAMQVEKRGSMIRIERVMRIWKRREEEGGNAKRDKEQEEKNRDGVHGSQFRSLACINEASSPSMKHGDETVVGFESFDPAFRTYQDCFL
ncbi:hypothetical protein BKA70DRAFT_1230925 [Coprinopsis sp. MPI-PUGE-AT-0042]|nr:hypothetical protein BKA70DRAFT_1230925 [Coprinopsis sp. MPI-PUGE-AT-0042]